MLEPDVVPDGCFPSDDNWTVTAPESCSEWYIDFYDQIKQKKAIEVIQNPGDLLFPSTYWHTAINIETSIAVTQNFVSSQNLFGVLNFLKSKFDDSLFFSFSDCLSKSHPQLIEAYNKKIEEENKPFSLFDTLLN
jgi:hypothetical protein